MKVKICGIQSIGDALTVAACGADAIGLLVGQQHASNDFISVDTAIQIAKSIPPLVTPVLVTHLENPDLVVQLIEAIKVTTVQVHSEMTPGDIEIIRRATPNVKILKSYHVVSTESLSYGEKYEHVVDGFVLDSINIATDQVGGTGLTHDWSISKSIVEKFDVPIILAGGLNPDNVIVAIKCVHPYGVDVNSGVKAEQGGHKDRLKVEAFINNAKGVGQC